MNQKTYTSPTNLEDIERHIDENLHEADKGAAPKKAKAEKELTFEEVNKHVEKTFDDGHQQMAASAAPGKTTVEQLKAIYAVVRPILLLVEQMSLLPDKVKSVLHLFILDVDYLTGQSSAKRAGAAAAVSVDQLKTIYIVVRPILRIVAGLPLIPAKWRQAISTFLTVLDVVTGTLGVA